MYFLELQHYKHQDSNLFDITGTVFDDIISNYKKTRKEMVSTLVQNIYKVFRDGMWNYISKKRMFSDTGEERISRDLTTEICEPLSILRQNIVTIEGHLCSSLFKKFWLNITAPINSYIYEEFIKKAYFSRQGALQFDFDMKTLVLVFKAYTQKPENFFKEIKESCRILTMESNEAEQFLKELEKPVKKGKESDVLAKYGIYKLNVDQIKPLFAQIVDNKVESL